MSLRRLLPWLVISVGWACVICALTYGAEITMDWYWWVLVGVGAALIFEGMNDA